MNDSSDPLAQMICPITLDLPNDPVVAEDGQLYDRHAIENALLVQLKSPITNKPIGSKLIPVRHVVNLLDSMIQRGDKDPRLLQWQQNRIQKQRIRNLSTEELKKRIVQHIRMCKNSKCYVCLRIRTRVRQIKSRIAQS